MNNILKVTILSLAALWLSPAISSAQEDDDPSIGASTATKNRPIATKATLDRRHALVGRDCMINRVFSIVSVGSWQSNTSNMTDEDITNTAEFPSVASVGVLQNPIVAVRDLSRYYQGVEAGFTMVAASTKVLDVSLLKNMNIMFYKDGKLVGTKAVKQGQDTGLLNLNLIGIGSTAEACVDLTAEPDPEWVFDEICFAAGGVNAEVASSFKFKYAFVGPAYEFPLTKNGIAKYAEETGRNYSITAEKVQTPVLIPIKTSADNLINGNDGDGASEAIVYVASVGEKGRARIDVKPATGDEETFPAGSEVGFDYTLGTGLNLEAGTWVKIKLFDKDGTKVQEERIEGNVLGLGLAHGGNSSTHITSSVPFSGAEIAFYTVLSVNAGTIVMQRGYVQLPPTIDHHCDIKPSANLDICSEQKTLQLYSSEDLTIEWRAVAWPGNPLDEEGRPQELSSEFKPEVSPSGKVTFTKGSTDDDGTYVFRATSLCGKCADTADHNCFEDVSVTKGSDQIADAIGEDDCDVALVNAGGDECYKLMRDMTGARWSGSLLSLKDRTGSEKIVDSSRETCAEYTPSAALVQNILIEGLWKDCDGYLYDGTDPAAKDVVRMGFVVALPSTGLTLNALNFYQIRAYDENGDEVYRGVIKQSNAVSLGLIGSGDLQKMKFSIDIPRTDDDGRELKIKGFALWTSGVAEVGVLSKINIYYPFMEDGSEDSDCNNPLGCGTQRVSNEETDSYVSSGSASINSDETKIIGAVSAGGAISGMSNMVDVDPNFETAMTIANSVGVGTDFVVSVNMGRTLDYHHQLGLVTDNKTYVANVGVANALIVETYYRGEPTGDRKSEWSVLGADVAGYGDKNLLLIQPKKKYDEVRITVAGGISALDYHNFYGLFLRNDIDNDGIPDCRDKDSCGENVEVTTDDVCQGTDITITCEWGGQVDRRLRIELPDQDGASAEVTIADASKVSTQLHTSNYGQFTGYIYDLDNEGKMIKTFDYYVHPLVSTWKVNPVNTDWNEWNNWTHGSPYLCTNVIIPTGAERYPVLDGEVTEGDEYPCAGIHFEPGAAVEYIHKLNYKDAWVDLAFEPSLGYLVAAALQDTHTGDMYVPAGGDNISTNDYFKSLTEANAPVSRFNPDVYQRLWENTEKNVAYSLTDNRKPKETKSETQVGIEETRWSHAFNALNHKFAMGEGSSILLNPGEAGQESFVVRLPKEIDTYYYFDEFTQEPSAFSETIGRNAPHRFVYEATDRGETVKQAFSKTVGGTTYNRQTYAGLLPMNYAVGVKEGTLATTFLVGNPLMSHLYVDKFLEGNKEAGNIAGMKYFDGNTVTSLISIGGAIETSSGEPVTRIKPMESFFVTTTSAAASVTITLTEDMLAQQTAPSNLQPLKTHPLKTHPLPLPMREGSGMFSNREVTTTLPPSGGDRGGLGQGLPSSLRLRISDGEHTTGTLLLDGIDAKAETLFDNEAKPTLAIFTISDGRAYDICGLDGRGEIPLGIYLGGARALTLSFDVRGQLDAGSYVLVDGETGAEYGLDDTVELELEGTTIGRFFLRDKRVTAIDDTVDEEGSDVMIVFNGPTATVTSPQADIKGIDVLAVDGRTLATVKGSPATTMQVDTTTDIGMLRIHRSGRKPVVRKFVSRF